MIAIKIVFREYQRYKFNGARTEEGIISWINDRNFKFAEIVTCDELP